MKFINVPIALFSLLIGERESSLILISDDQPTGVVLCKLLLKHEAELFIRDLRFTVAQQFRGENDYWRERYHESQEAFDSEKHQIHGSINAFESMIQDVLSGPEKKCAHINAIAHRLARRPVKDLSKLSDNIKGRDQFFVSLGVELLSLHPDVNLMKYAGIVDEAIREDVSVLFEIAQRVGLSRHNLGKVLETLWSNSRTEFASKVSSLGKFFEESNIPEFRMRFPALDGLSDLKGKPALYRLRKATGLFFWTDESIVYDYRALNSFISRKGPEVIENESLTSGMNAVSDILELIAFIPPSQPSSRDAAQKAIVSLRKAFSADGNSSEQKKHIAIVISTASQALPGLKQAAYSSLDGLVGDVLNEINSIHVEAKFLIAPVLRSLLAREVVGVDNKVNESPNLPQQHFAFLKAVFGTSIQILKNRASRSLVALADLLYNFSLNGNLLRQDPNEMGTRVLNVAFQFGLRFGIDMLGKYPNLLPNLSEKRIEMIRKIFLLFIQFGEDEWNRLFSYSLSSRLASASEDTLENCVAFLDKYNLSEQARRLDGIYNDVPLIMPGRFLREYLGIESETEETTEPSPYSVSVLKVLPLLHRATIQSRSGASSRVIPALISHNEISPFLGLHARCYELSWDISKIYLTHGSFFQCVYPDLIQIARSLPSDILHSAVDSGEDQHSRLLQAARTLLGLMQAIIDRGAEIPENSIAITACPKKLSDHIRLIGSAQNQNVLVSMFDRLDLLAQVLRDITTAVYEKRAFQAEICSN